MKNNNLVRMYGGTVIRYLFPILMTILTLKTTKNITYVGLSLLELVSIFLFVNLLLDWNKILGKIIGFLLVFLFSAQMIVLYFAKIFTSWVMLTNLASIEDLSGKAIQYGGTVLVFLVIMLRPVRHVPISAKKSIVCLLATVVTEMILCFMIGTPYTPITGTLDLYQQYKEQMKIHETVATLRNQQSEEDAPMKDVFYNDVIEDYIAKPEELVQQPNIIFILTEALSKNIVEDERQIMPNAKALEQKSISFEHYFNHTFATYRALMGQYYSGHQLENMDENHLISFVDILEDLGYQTAFVNGQPLNEDFTEYVARLTSESFVLPIEEATHYGTIPDQYAYDQLFEKASEKNESGQPFFISMYTIGTHASFDSPELKFGDGSDPMLNKFHYVDDALGSFLEKFENSPMFDNTILVFTADHSCYADEDFTHAFPDYEREIADCDEIPLYFYYKGVTPEKIDVNGRNSIDFAPTLMDYLDISAPNYFLGRSLFAPEEGVADIEYMFYDPTYKLSTKDHIIQELSEEQLSYFNDILTRYFAIKVTMQSYAKTIYEYDNE